MRLEAATWSSWGPTSERGIAWRYVHCHGWRHRRCTTFLVVDQRFRGVCECKTDESVFTDPDGYTYSVAEAPGEVRRLRHAALARSALPATLSDPVKRYVPLRRRWKQTAPPKPPALVESGEVGPGVEVRSVSSASKEIGPPLEKPLRLVSESWHDLVMTFPCERCGAPAPSDPAHIKVIGRRGDRIDWTLIPLCRRCHTLHHDGVVDSAEVNRLLGDFLVRQLPQLRRSDALTILREMIAFIEA